jgi:hypothetical protein
MPDEEARWMTYEALAQARGTTKRAAVVLVRRKKWPRQKNNAGHVTALVPVTWATETSSAQPEEGAGHSAPNGAGHAIAVLERTVEALREAHAMERSALQGQIAELRAAAARADAAAQEAREAADDLRRADEARKARGRWARLRATWRGE